MRLVLVVAAVAGSAWAVSMAGPLLAVSRNLPDADALLVLGSHEWERLPLAARIAATQPAAVVLLTQPSRPTASNCHLCSERVSWLGELGTPPDRVELLPRRVTNTYDEALAARQYSLMHPIRRLLLVTSPYHARRALAVFRMVFEGADVSIGVRFDDLAATPRGWWRRPYDRAYVAYEWAALTWYAVRHGVNPLLPDDWGTAAQVNTL
jgi:uncharacterized SAM-binding protein YcdF (DUF218 family)